MVFVAYQHMLFSLIKDQESIDLETVKSHAEQQCLMLKAGL